MTLQSERDAVVGQLLRRTDPILKDSTTCQPRTRWSR
jgi:hypothetical protein